MLQVTRLTITTNWHHESETSIIPTNDYYKTYFYNNFYIIFFKIFYLNFFLILLKFKINVDMCLATLLPPMYSQITNIMDHDNANCDIHKLSNVKNGAEEIDAYFLS